MSSFENRRQLPLVLDEVHRRTLASRLQAVGFEVRTGSWDELQDLSEAYDRRASHDDYTLGVTYAGTNTFGLLFGGTQRLVESFPAWYVSGVERFGLGELMMRREIRICPSDDPALSPARSSKILCIPDSPPVALHGDSCTYIGQRFKFEEVGSDAGLVEKIRSNLEPEAIEFVSEVVAAGVIRALTQDDAFVTRM